MKQIEIGKDDVALVLGKEANDQFSVKLILPTEVEKMLDDNTSEIPTNVYVGVRLCQLLDSTDGINYLNNMINKEGENKNG